MKKSLRIILILFTIHFSPFAFAQEIPLNTEQQLENQADAEQGETEDDSYLQDLEQFRKNPINLNTANADDLKQVRILSDLQINHLISYRNLFGNFISIYEIQALPAWDMHTIRKLIPYITIEGSVSLPEETRKRFRSGEHSLLLRVSQIMERSAGFVRSATGSKYPGSPQKILFRYRYSYKNLLQFGWLGDKDAGEQFLKGSQKNGFDFYTFHFYAKRIGIIHSLALGDFTVNMGQGLIQWQGLAFKKSAEVMGVKRQSEVIRPYCAAGEFYFHRGAGITIRVKKLEVTAFVSFRKLSANLVADTIKNENFISSFLTSGYHRTILENSEKNNLSQLVTGGNIVYKKMKWQVGVNAIWYHFSLPVHKREEPYNLYSFTGKDWNNFSVDYSYTHRNFHFFGEAAADKNLHKAFINGLLISVDPNADIALVQRTIRSAYQSVNGNAFTENTYPTNETGFYTGITIRPVMGFRIDAYGDICKFPWIKYQVDAPGYGKEFLVQLTYTPNKQAELYTKFRVETKQSNNSDPLPGYAGTVPVTNYPVDKTRRNWRTQVSFKINSAITLRSRVELLWNKKDKRISPEKGFLGFFDLLYKPMLKSYNAVLRIQYFETDGYDSRIYAYENDVMYSYSIPAVYDRGFRYYINLNYDISRNISLWLRWARTIYRDKAFLGSGPDKIDGNKKSEIRLQVRWIFGAKSYIQ